MHKGGIVFSVVFGAGISIPSLAQRVVAFLRLCSEFLFLLNETAILCISTCTHIYIYVYVGGYLSLPCSLPLNPNLFLCTPALPSLDMAS